MPAQFTRRNETQIPGAGTPAPDVNNVVDAVKAQGAVFNVLNAAYRVAPARLGWVSQTRRSRRA